MSVLSPIVGKFSIFNTTFVNHNWGEKLYFEWRLNISGSVYQNLNCDIEKLVTCWLQQMNISKYTRLKCFCRLMTGRAVIVLFHLFYRACSQCLSFFRLHLASFSCVHLLILKTSFACFRSIFFIPNANCDGNCNFYEPFAKHTKLNKMFFFIASTHSNKWHTSQ